MVRNESVLLSTLIKHPAFQEYAGCEWLPESKLELVNIVHVTITLYLFFNTFKKDDVIAF